MTEIIFGILGLLVGIAGLIFVALTMRQTAKIHRQTTDAQIFLECTARFNALTEFHELLVHDRLSEPYTKSPKIDAAICSYYDLLSQEYHLNQQHILCDNVWQLWQDDIQMIVDTPLMRQAWQCTVLPRFANHQDFCHYVEGLLSSSPPTNPA